MLFRRRRPFAGVILTLVWLCGGPGLTILEAAAHAERVAFHTHQAHLDPGDTVAHGDHCALGLLGPISDPRLPTARRFAVALVRSPHRVISETRLPEPLDSRLPPSRGPPIGSLLDA